MRQQFFDLEDKTGGTKSKDKKINRMSTHNDFMLKSQLVKESPNDMNLNFSINASHVS